MTHVLEPPPVPFRIAHVLGMILVLSGSGVFTAPDANGQTFGRLEETKSNVAYFYHARPGEATVQVSVWGTIPRPGIYEVPDTTTLDKLMTMAGGAPLEARQEDQDAPTITVRVYRPGASGRNQIFEAKLDRMLRESPSYPSLRDNDIVVVETVRPAQPFGWRDVLSVLSTLGTLTLLGLRIFTRV